MELATRNFFTLPAWVALLALAATSGHAGSSETASSPIERPPGCSIGVLTCSEDFVSEVKSALLAAPNETIKEKLSSILKSFDEANYSECIGAVLHLKQIDERAEVRGYYESWTKYLKNILYPEKPPGFKSPGEISLPWAKRPVPSVKDRLAHLQWLYEGGVEAYAHGDLNLAISFFQRVLNMDAGNTSAARAMRRVQKELNQPRVGSKKGAP